MRDDDLSREFERQRVLLAAVAGGTVPAGLRRGGARGMMAYRAHAEASAERALASTFPTVRAMLGGEDFDHLAREFRAAHPPSRGDLGEWGDDLADWLAAHAGLVRWPWLADSARLDLALHRCERAADAVFDAGSLQLLGASDPARLRIELLPGSALVVSAFPIATLLAAHRTDPPSTAALADAREAIAAARAEAVLVARQGWRAVAHPLAPEIARQTAVLLHTHLSAALADSAVARDFGAWLASAVRLGWLHRVVETTAA